MVRVGWRRVRMADEEQIFESYKEDSSCCESLFINKMGNTKLLLSDKLKLELKPSPEKAVESIHLVKKTSDGNVNIGVFALEDWYKVMQQMSELLEAIQKYKDEGDVDFWTEDDPEMDIENVYDTTPKKWNEVLLTFQHSPMRRSALKPILFKSSNATHVRLALRSLKESEQIIPSIYGGINLSIEELQLLKKFEDKVASMISLLIQEKEREDIRKQERKRRFWSFSSTTFLLIKSPEENG